MRNTAEDEIGQTLSAAGVSTVYEAAGRAGGMVPEIRPIAPGQQLFGRALTARCVPGDNLAVHRAVAEARAGEVLVVDGSGLLVGYWGEVLMTAAQVRGLAGLVIDGGVRDVSALRARGFPVWARGVSMRSAVKVAPGEIRQSISCGGVVVANGDWVVADDDGVVIVPVDRVMGVAEAANVRMAKEAIMLERIAAGETTLDLFGLRGLAEGGAG